MTPISAQSGDWDAVVTAAKQEGKLLIYNGTNFPVVRKIAAEMQKTYGITVDVLDGRATEIRERIRIEQSTNRTVASLSYSGFTTLFTQSQEGAFRITGCCRMRRASAPELASKGQIALGSVGLFILMYNTSLVKDDAPKSWQDVTDPGGREKSWLTIFAQPVLATSGLKPPTTRSAEPSTKRWRCKSRYSAATFRRASGVSRAANIHSTCHSTSPNTPALRGLPIKAIVPAEGAPYVPFGSAMLRDAPHPNAARVFLNFLLSETGQTLLAAEGFRPAVSGYESKAPPGGRSAAGRQVARNNHAGPSR